MKLSSSNGWTKVPSAPGYARASSACHAISYGTRISFALNARIRSSFAAGAGSIATTGLGTPAFLAAYAPPCPAFAALLVHTPRVQAVSIYRLSCARPSRGSLSLRGPPSTSCSCSFLYRQPDRVLHGLYPPEKTDFERWRLPRNPQINLDPIG